MAITPEQIVDLMKQIGISIDTSTLSHSANLRDSGLDSLDMANLFLAIEENFQVAIPDTEVDELISVTQIAEFVNRSSASQ